MNSRRLGKWLSRIKGRVVDAHRIEMKADASNGNRFSLCQVSGSDHSAGTHVAADYRASSAPEF